MRKKTEKYIIIIIAVILMSGIWPMGLITREVISKSGACDYYESGHIQDDAFYAQEFVPQYSYLESISIQISRDSTFQHGDEGSIVFSVFDENIALVFSMEERVSNIVNKQYQEFEINQKVKKGAFYRYQLEGFGCVTAGPTVRYGEKRRIGLQENQIVHDNGKATTDYSTVAVYKYRVPIAWGDILVYDTWIVTIAAICYTVMKLFRNNEGL